MGIAVVGIILVAALFCEWVIVRSFGGSIYMPSATALAVILIMFVLPFSWGLWVAGVWGFVIDSIALPPFGATILLFLFLACAIEIIRIVIAESKSYLAKVAVVAGLYILAYIAAPAARVAAALLRL